MLGIAQETPPDCVGGIPPTQSGGVVLCATLPKQDRARITPIYHSDTPKAPCAERGGVVIVTDAQQTKSLKTALEGHTMNPPHRRPKLPTRPKLPKRADEALPERTLTNRPVIQPVRKLEDH